MSNRKFSFVAVFLSSLLAASLRAQVVDSLKIAEQMGVATANYPIQLGRPFIQGEIANFPQAILNGTPVATQADVKQRWPDGSVKHAIIAFLIPNLAAYQTVTVTFQNQGSGNNAPLSPAQMLGSNFNFDAQMQLTNGSTITADARAMLMAASGCAAPSGTPQLCTLWTSGGIAQTIILADHSTNRAYDIGFDSNLAFRPIFQATFWPTVNKVTVRFIGENASTQALEDQTYSLALTTGNSPATQVYTKASFTQSGATRWTKLFWIGGAPSPVAIDHNLTYIANTKFFPNYYNQVALTGATVANYCKMWNSANQDIGGAGNWDISMPDPGARPDIGPFPDWSVLWVYSGNSCLQNMATGNADLAASWPVHLREGLNGKRFLRTDAGGSSTGLGHVVSISGRPSVNGYQNQGTAAQDQINPVGSFGVNGFQGWDWNQEHNPDTASIEYTLTGDFWYLEEMWFFSAYYVSSFYYSGGSAAESYWRGPTGSEGILWHDAIRSEAWELRDWIETAFASPDGTPEQSYFTQLISDAIAFEEGVRNITTTSNYMSAIWNWGQDFAPIGSSDTSFPGSGPVPAGTIPVLHQWSGGSSAFVQSEYGICGWAGDGSPNAIPTPPPCNTNPTVSAAASLFEMHYLMYVLGRATELGYPSTALMNWLGTLFVGMITSSGANPYLVANGRIPTMDINGNYYPTYASLNAGYTTDSNGVPWPTVNFLPNTDADGYGAHAVAAVSYTTGLPSGPAAWTFMQNNYPWSNFSTEEPKWAVIPRGGPVLAQASSCDLNKDGSVDAADVQSAINQTLGTAACTGDLVGTGTCTVVDVQRVINAALGGICRLGQ